jgi:hypothetical protein
LLCYGNIGFANPPKCYVYTTLPVVFRVPPPVIYLSLKIVRTVILYFLKTPSKVL